METQYHLVDFFFQCYDTRVNSDWTKTVIVTFVLTIINSKSVSKTTFTRAGFIRVNVKLIKIYPYSSVAFIFYPKK